MKKTRELWWFLVPWLMLSFLENVFTLRDIVDSPLIQGVSLASLLPDLLFGCLGDLVGTVITGALVGGILLLIRRRVRFSRRRFYILVFLVTVLLFLLFYFAQLRWFFFSPRILTSALQTGSATAFAVWLAELVWKRIKKPQKEEK